MSAILDVLDAGTGPVSSTDFILAKTVAETLHAHYPGQRWAVTCDNGMITIRNLWCSGIQGYVLLVDKAYSASHLMKRAVQAGGEILERYRMARGRFDEAKYIQLPTDFAGRLEFDR